MAVPARVLALAFLLLSLELATVPVESGNNQWTGYGVLPNGSPVFGIAVDPAAAPIVYAATLGHGLFRTFDGRGWTPMGQSVLPPNLWRVVTDAAKGPGGFPPIYVGSAGDGFYKSVDGATTWQRLNAGLRSTGSLNVRSIALGHGIIVIGTSDGVYKTVDGGASWQTMGLPGSDISAVMLAQTEPPYVVLAGIDGSSHPGSRLMRTKDGGGSWQPLSRGLPQTEPSNQYVVTALAAGPVPTGATLRPLFMAGGSGVFKSDDGGDSWAQLSGLPPQGFSVVAASSADPNIVYAGSDASPPPPGTTPGPGTTGGGVWRSADRGGTWTPLASGLDEHQITALGVARNSPTSVYAAAYNSDKKTVTPYELTDVLAPPAGQPEGGFCPEGPCQGVTALASPSPGALSPSPEGSPCASPATAPAPTPRGTSPLATASPRPGRPSGAVASPPARTSITQPSGALASASPSSLIPTAAPTPCQSGGITLPLGPRHDLPLGLGAGVLGLLLVLLAARLVITRR